MKTQSWKCNRKFSYSGLFHPFPTYRPNIVSHRLTECDFLPLAHDTHITYTLADTVRMRRMSLLSAVFISTWELPTASCVHTINSVRTLSSYGHTIISHYVYITHYAYDWMSIKQMLSFHLCTFSSFSFFLFSLYLQAYVRVFGHRSCRLLSNDRIRASCQNLFQFNFYFSFLYGLKEDVILWH